MTNKRMRTKTKMKRKSCHHLQILFHLKLRLLQMLQRKKLKKRQRPSKKKMQNRVKSLRLLPSKLKSRKAKLKKYQLLRKHK